MNQVKVVIKTLLHGISHDEMNDTLEKLELSILTLTTRMFPLMAMISSGVANTSLRVIVIYDIISIFYHVPRCMILYHVRPNKKLLVLVLINVLGVVLRQLNMSRYQISAAMYHRNRELFLHLSVLNQVVL